MQQKAQELSQELVDATFTSEPMTEPEGCTICDRDVELMDVEVGGAITFLCERCRDNIEDIACGVGPAASAIEHYEEMSEEIAREVQ